MNRGAGAGAGRVPWSRVSYQDSLLSRLCVSGCHRFIPLVSYGIHTCVVRAYWFLSWENSFLMALFVIAGFFGSLVGRKMGDFLSARDPDPGTGRIVLAQIISAPAIILVFSFFSIFLISIRSNKYAQF